MSPLNNNNKFTPQYSVSLVDQVTEYLTNAIIRGELKGGERLVENELQRNFGISRAPIRESFRILEKLGFVVTLPRKGTFVRKVTQKDVQDYFPVRASLEGLAARLSVPHLGSEDIKEMELAFSEMRRAIDRGSFRSYLKQHSEFHDIFIRASRNDILIGMINNLGRLAPMLFSRDLYVRQAFKYAISSHHEILNAFLERDTDRSESVVEEHILKVGDWFLEFSLLEKKEENGDAK